MGMVVSLADRLVVVRDAAAIEQHRHDQRRARNNAAARPRRAKQRAARLQRVPTWADTEEIRKIYEACAEKCRRTGRLYEVDHIIPLLGNMVSGLHVAANLRIVPRRVNREKRNSFTIE